MEASADTRPAVKPRKGRSPSYPAINLETAIARAEQLWAIEGSNSAPVSVVLGHWGYGPKSGGGAAILAALKKFGLLVDEGSASNRRARLTDLARDIVLDDRPGSSERIERIREAALKPAIHAELWSEFRSTQLPSDQALKFTLVRDRSFTESGAQEFLSELRSTLAFAGLTPGQPLDEPVFGDSEPSGPVVRLAPSITGASASTAGPASAPGTRSVQLPLPDTEWATLQGPFPVSEAAWQQLLAVLSAMKPALVRNPVESGEAD